MSEDLKKLIHKRGLIKSRLTRFKAYLDDQQRDLSEFQLSSRLARLRECWSEFDSIQTEIELAPADSKSLNEALTEREIFEETYFELETRFAELIKTGISTSAISPTNENSFVSGIQLPALTLPSFSGAYDEWVPFHDTFNSLIHSNGSLSPIQKLHYLKSSLKGAASHLVDSLEISATNYEVAWQLLKDRYENKRIIISKHVQEILNSPPVTKESVSALRRLLDESLKHVRALKALGQPTEHLDTLLIHIVSHKLESTTKRAWELTLQSNELPVFEDLISFLSQRCKTLEASENDQCAHQKALPSVSPGKPTMHYRPPGEYSRKFNVNIAAQPSSCPFCEKVHQLFQCSSFLKLTTSEKINKCRQFKLCMNCLRRGHMTINCKSASCKKCGKRHNTLLHLEQPIHEPSTTSTPQPQSGNEFCLHNINESPQIILATAIIHIADSGGRLHHCRALLDSGSQSNLITNSLARSLGLRRIKACKPIMGINQNISRASHFVRTNIKSRMNAFASELDFVVLPRITGDLPSATVHRSSLHVPRNIQLADPYYYRPSRIDVLLGAELFWRMCVGQIRISNNLPILQKTILGWVVSGKITTKACSQNSFLPTYCNLTTREDNLEDTMKRFWEIEQINKGETFLSEEERACEDHFQLHFRRGLRGRFSVRLPFRHDPHLLGNSKTSTLTRFKKLERRFTADQQLKREYSNFINEYLELDHMELLGEAEINPSKPVFYLPHHAVIKQTSAAKKLRVVFDGSAKSSTGISLNDILMVGPVVQRDLFSILLSFRSYAFVFTTDIQHMYRQIKLQSPDTDMQLILWRDSPKEELKTYRLNTVTYGLSSSSFLATRCLLQLARDEGTKFPLAAAALENNCYMDDIISGANTLEEALKLQVELKKLLESAKFKLHKWCANNPALLEGIPIDDQEASYQLPNEFESTIKTLGMLWQPVMDHFCFIVSPIANEVQFSKRGILSDISRLFDPLGLLGPITVKAKIIMQKLWQLKLQWDESIPTDIHTEWVSFRRQLGEIHKIQIPRSIIQGENSTELQLYGFCDASEVAYGACIYVRSVNDKGRIKVTLLCAKSRVAPLKKITIPRLELCSALLLAQLVSKVSSHLKFQRYFLWTDSNIVLAWLSSHPKTWKTFIANRVAEIQELTGNMEWGHVSSSQNPADVLSRGSFPLQLLHSNFWWSGPTWISDLNSIPPSEDDARDYPVAQLERISDSIQIHLAVDVSSDIFKRFSSFTKLKRVIAYCLRFVYNSKLSNRERQTGILTLGEIQNAVVHLIRVIQLQHFGPELEALRKEKEIPPNSSLKSLNPFLDDKGLIRVGGRLKNSQLNYDQKHPIVLPKNEYLTELIIKEFHILSLHSGPQALLCEVRQCYWPIHGKKLAHKVVSRCLNCFKVNPTTSKQLMGQLPPPRVTPSRAFDSTGIDYFGPVWYRRVQQRRSPPVKGYAALFVCLSTKAIHLELVSDLTTASFLAALRRFMARRGRPQDLYSDNATNFVGARNELSALRRLFLSQQHQSEVSRSLSEYNVTWHFIPPKSPHFGGLWEAGVKSAKRHILRVIGNAILSYEELNTLITQIEACINSRPITPMSNDPNDLMPLTPGHFLIGQPLTSMPEPDLIPLQVNRLSRWQHVQQLFQAFWRRWSTEYLSSLQQRTKWRVKSGNLRVGSLVLLSEENQPPLQWKTGRVVELHPGGDGLCRVVTVKTSTGLLKRSINKLCILPIDS